MDHDRFLDSEIDEPPRPENQQTASKTCQKCGKALRWSIASHKIKNKNGDTILVCHGCHIKELREEELSAEYKRYSDKNSNFSNEQIIANEIKKLENASGSEIVLVILGVIGLFFFLLPGIIFFIWAFSLSNSRKTKAVSLRGQLESLRHAKSAQPTSKSSNFQNHLDVLKMRFAKNEISESEYRRKKRLLEEI